ncbi:hypothetical protein [Halococcus sediminicola]|uniref:hypothetical protein n=1 Tax=Halococcus sediminicola TaxID=1264579 RepID=UPI0006785B9E|nr:hypothetical protein [Halococcus sediminicola]
MRATKALTASFLLAALLVAATGTAAAAETQQVEDFEDGAGIFSGIGADTTSNYSYAGTYSYYLGNNNVSNVYGNHYYSDTLNLESGQMVSGWFKPSNIGATLEYGLHLRNSSYSSQLYAEIASDNGNLTFNVETPQTGSEQYVCDLADNSNWRKIELRKQNSTHYETRVTDSSGSIQCHPSFNVEETFDELRVSASNAESYTAYIDNVAYNYESTTSDNTTSDNSTDNTTDDTTEYNITKLRDVPGEQSFTYLNSGDSANISIENDTVTADSDNAAFLTRQIRADKYDRIELDTSGSVTVEVLDAQNDSENESVLKTETVSGMATVNISDVNTTGIQVRMTLDNGTEITDFKLYGDTFSGGLFGGGNLITGNFFGNIPVVGNFLSGLTAGVNNVISGILNIPMQMFEGIMEVIPSL